MKSNAALLWIAAILVLVAVEIAPAAADDKSAVSAMDTNYQAAVKANDATTMGRILADDFILINGDGKVSTKNDLLDEARTGGVIYEHQDGTDQTVRLWGNTAVVTAKLWGKGTEGGKPFDWTLWYSDTYVKTSAGWRYAFGQASLPLPPISAAVTTTPKSHVEIPVVAPRREDVSSVEAIVKADYESISGGVGVPRQWGRDLSLYDPNARSFSVYKDSATPPLTRWAPSLQEYADEADAHFVKDGFTERELAHKISRFGNIATVFSSYEGALASTGKEYSRGVNVYQLMFDGQRWWITSVSWDSENYVNAIPPELMPKN